MAWGDNESDVYLPGPRGELARMNIRDKTFHQGQMDAKYGRKYNPSILPPTVPNMYDAGFMEESMRMLQKKDLQQWQSMQRDKKKRKKKIWIEILK